MPASHRFDPVARILFVTLSGPVEGPEAVAFQAELLRSTAPGVGVHLDVRGQTTTPDAPRIREFIDQFAKSSRRPSHLAIVTNRNAMYGMARMLSALSEGLGIRITVHRDPEDALRSLEEDRASRA